MAARRFKATWEQVSALDADHIASWGAFAGYAGPITFDDTEPRKLHVEHDRQRDTFSVFYVWKGDDDTELPIRDTACLERRACRFGGTRAYFMCPCCLRRTLRLAVLRIGLRCGTCASITWGSRRETEARRLVRKANKLALRLGLDYFDDAPKRPPHMRTATYARIMAELAPLKAEIDRRVAARMARAKGPLAAWDTLLRWGL